MLNVHSSLLGIHYQHFFFGHIAYVILVFRVLCNDLQPASAIYLCEVVIIDLGCILPSSHIYIYVYKEALLFNLSLISFYG